MASPTEANKGTDLNNGDFIDLHISADKNIVVDWLFSNVALDSVDVLTGKYKKLMLNAFPYNKPKNNSDILKADKALEDIRFLLDSNLEFKKIFYDIIVNR